MSSVLFNFPPESYSAVYTVDGTTNANVVGKCNLSDSCEVSGSPPGIVHTPPSSLFSCFHCAFQNGINFTRKKKRRKENHTANHKVYQLITVEHTVEVCPAWAEHRSVLEAAIGGGDLSRPALVQAMVRGETEWDAVTSFCEAVMLAKEVAERERERTSHRPGRRGRRPGRPP